jgi:putative flavoprotein involved in K+ transport
MSVPELVTFFEHYAAASRTPVMTGTAVCRVERHRDRFRILTSRGSWSAHSVVIATGHCDLPAIPAVSRSLPSSITQLVPAEYRRPEGLPPGNVLVVGASSTGVQLADEIQRSGREVTLAAGRHTRLPRSYRGLDIFTWLDRLGVLGQDLESVPARDASRHQPSLQLIGTPEHRAIDLGTLRASGVRVAGRVRHIGDGRVHLADDLLATTAAADVKMADMLTRIDDFIDRTGADAAAPEPFEPTWPIAADTVNALDLRAERIATIIWATGYRRAYPWLQVPVLDSRGEIVHAGGITAVRGLYVLGMHFQRRRNSSFIDGVGADAWAVADDIASTLTRAHAA